MSKKSIKRFAILMALVLVMGAMSFLMAGAECTSSNHPNAIICPIPNCLGTIHLTSHTLTKDVYYGVCPLHENCKIYTSYGYGYGNCPATPSHGGFIGGSEHSYSMWHKK